jgi:hypothetical protein
METMLPARRPSSGSSARALRSLHDPKHIACNNRAQAPDDHNGENDDDNMAPILGFTE